MTPKEILQQLLNDLVNMRAAVNEHLTNALFEIDRAITAIQRSIKEIDETEEK